MAFYIGTWGGDFHPYKWSDLGPHGFQLGGYSRTGGTKTTRGPADPKWIDGENVAMMMGGIETLVNSGMNDHELVAGFLKQQWLSQSWLINESDWHVDTKYKNPSFCLDMFCHVLRFFQHENRCRKKLEKNMQRWRTPWAGSGGLWPGGLLDRQGGM